MSDVQFEQAVAAGTGFGFAYMSAVQKAADELQEYLYSHNGYIDSCPVPFTDIGFELKGKDGQSIKYEFEYFGSDFGVQNVKKKVTKR